MPRWAMYSKHWIQWGHAGNANINNKDINNDDKQVSLRTNSNLQSRRFSRTLRFIFLLSPMSFSVKYTDFSFDVCCHPSCHSFKTSQLAGFNSIRFPDCTLHWVRYTLPHPGVRGNGTDLAGFPALLSVSPGTSEKASTFSLLFWKKEVHWLLGH